MNRPETAIGNGSRWLDGLGGLDEPSLGLSPVLVTEIFRCPMSALGRVSRVTPVQTAMRNCTRDEGRPFEVGNHVSISSRCKLLWSKAMVVSVAVTSGQEVQAGKVGRGERKRTVDEVSKAD